MILVPDHQDVNAARGAYGLRVAGLEDAAAHLPVVPASWPALTVGHGPLGGRAPEPPGTIHWHENRVEVWIGARDVADVVPGDGTVRLAGDRRPPDALLVHPYLATPAALVSHALGRQVLHGGAFLHEDGAWGVLGHKEAGKSSALAWLHRRGAAVVSDDLLVVEDGTLFAGPPCLDLREAAAEALGLGGDARVRPDRVRLATRPVPVAVPLRGFVVLDWGDAVDVRRLGLVDALEHLAAQRIVLAGRQDPAAWLDLAARPVWRLTRPRDLARMDEALDQLLAALA